MDSIPKKKGGGGGNLMKVWCILYIRVANFQEFSEKSGIFIPFAEPMPNIRNFI